MSPVSQTLSRLISRGICDYSCSVDPDELNRLLRPLGYEAVMWPSKSHFVLRDLSESSAVLPPWKEQTADEAKRVFTKIIAGEAVDSALLGMLVKYGWVEDDNGRLGLSKRALVQFDQFIAGFSKGRYRRCILCDFMVDSDDYHAYCRELLNKRQE